MAASVLETQPTFIYALAWFIGPAKHTAKEKGPPSRGQAAASQKSIQVATTSRAASQDAPPVRDTYGNPAI
jgi:hypothetical protein